MIDDEDEVAVKPPRPSVSFSITKPFSHVLVVPSTMAIITSVFDKSPCGAIDVFYEYHSLEEPDVYDDDEQLYLTHGSGRVLPSESAKVYEILPGTIAIEVPHFSQPIVDKLVAMELAGLVAGKNVTVLAPGTLGFGQALGRLDLGGSRFTEVPLVLPPTFITGISAALVATLGAGASLLTSEGTGGAEGAGSSAGAEGEGQSQNVAALVLQSEGQPGYEKVDADAIVEAGKAVFQSWNQPGKVAALSSAVRKLNSSSTSGMYL